MHNILVLSILVVVFTYGECGFLWNKNVNHEEENVSCLKDDVNEYLDKVLEKARQELPDPMRLPPRSIKVVELSDGVLWGMSNLTRKGEAIVKCEGDIIHIKGKATTDELKGRYTWTHQKKDEKKEGYIVFISHDVELDAEIVIEKVEGEVTHPRLQRFEIQRFKNTKIEISGASYLGWALGEVASAISGIFERVIARTVQDPVREALERQLREINIE